MQEISIFQRFLNLLSFAGELPFKWGQMVANDVRLSKENQPHGKPIINWWGVLLVIAIIYLVTLGAINIFTKLKNLKK